MPDIAPMEEPTAEYTVQDLAPAIPLRVTLRTTVACKTDVGRVRENNEDKFEYFIPEDERSLATRGHLYVVCDGMGGHEAGQIASELACKTFIEVYRNHPSDEPGQAMHAAVHAANRYVLEDARNRPKRKGMGCTLTALILLQDRFFIVNVGDSRVYLQRDGELMRLTVDHTIAEEYVRLGMLSKEEAERHPQKHVLTRAIGVEGVTADVISQDLQVGDIFMLCSDGLTNHVEHAAIDETLKSKSPSDAAWSLVGQALNGGGSDNTTTIVVRVDAIEPIAQEA